MERNFYFKDGEEYKPIGHITQEELETMPSVESEGMDRRILSNGETEFTATARYNKGEFHKAGICIGTYNARRKTECRSCEFSTECVRLKLNARLRANGF